MRHVIFTMLLAVLLVSCATTKTQLPTDNVDELLGVAWINPEYDRYVGKVVWNVDGTCDVYSKASDKNAATQTKYMLKEKWMEPDGSIFINFIWSGHGGHNIKYVLLRISSDRSFYEYVDHQKEFLSEIDPKYPKYKIYYRQK